MRLNGHPTGLCTPDCGCDPPPPADREAACRAYIASAFDITGPIGSTQRVAEGFVAGWSSREKSLRRYISEYGGADPNVARAITRAYTIASLASTLAAAPLGTVHALSTAAANGLAANESPESGLSLFRDALEILKGMHSRLSEGERF